MTADNWQARAACRTDPDRWFSASADKQRHAAHTCLAHCPVYVQCRIARDDPNGAGPCGASVHAGVVYSDQWAKPLPVANQPNPDAVRCKECGTTEQLQVKRKPVPIDMATLVQLAGLGLTDTQIADRLGIDRRKVTRLRRAAGIEPGAIVQKAMFGGRSVA